MSEYSLEKDHEAIKKQIKKWEKTIDEAIKCLQDQEVKKDTHDHNACIEELEEVSHEMMTINL